MKKKSMRVSLFDLVIQLMKRHISSLDKKRAAIDKGDKIYEKRLGVEWRDL